MKQNTARLLNFLNLSTLDSSNREKSFWELLKLVATSNRPKYRLRAALAIIQKCFPIYYRILPYCLLNYRQLPFAHDRNPRLLSAGTEHTVYELTVAGSRLALKINHRSYGAPLQQGIERQKRSRDAYRKTTIWFEEVRDFIPEQQFLIVQGPLRSYPAMAIIQPFYEDIRDVFEDFTDEQLTAMLCESETLREQFLAVVRILNKLCNEQGMTIDLLGDKNFAFVKRDLRHTFLLLDPNTVVSFALLGPDRRERYEERLARLNAISVSLRAVPA